MIAGKTAAAWDLHARSPGLRSSRTQSATYRTSDDGI